MDLMDFPFPSQEKENVEGFNFKGGALSVMWHLIAYAQRAHDSKQEGCNIVLGS